MNIQTKNIAFVFIGCGAYARTYKCEVAIESLCKVAGWKGKIYLLTDSPDCYNMDKLRADSGNDNITSVPVPEFSNVWDTPLKLSSKFPFLHTVPARKVIKSKLLKASVFKYVEDTTDTVIYCDSDLVFAREDLTEKVIDFAQKWPDTQSIKMSRSGSKQLHSGLFIAHREHSEKMLKLWKENMLDSSQWSKDPFDRTKLEKALAEIRTENKFEREQLPEYIEKFYSPGKELAFATHISIARILKNDVQKLIDFIDNLKLNSCSAEGYISPKMSKAKRYFWYLAYAPFKGTYKVEDQ